MIKQGKSGIYNYIIPSGNYLYVIRCGKKNLITQLNCTTDSSQLTGLYITFNNDIQCYE